MPPAISTHHAQQGARFDRQATELRQSIIHSTRTARHGQKLPLDKQLNRDYTVEPTSYSQLEFAEGGVAAHDLGVKQLVLAERNGRHQRRACRILKRSLAVSMLHSVVAARPSADKLVHQGKRHLMRTTKTAPLRCCRDVHTWTGNLPLRWQPPPGHTKASG